MVIGAGKKKVFGQSIFSSSFFHSTNYLWKLRHTVFKPRFIHPVFLLLVCRFVSISLFLVVYVKEGEACEIDESTRPALDLAAKLLGVEGDMLETAMVSKMMAVRGSAQADHIIRASFRSCCCCRASNSNTVVVDFPWCPRW